MPLSRSRIRVHGYAIVSADDRITDASGATPAALRNDADWAYFQRGLDGADLVVLGRLGHEANPNRHNRRRLVLSSRVDALAEREGAWWWNPAGLAWDEVCARLLPHGGDVAVPGGRRVFDLFLTLGYEAFHLSRAEGVTVGEGDCLFTACVGGLAADSVLRRNGLEPDPASVLDPEGPVTLTIYRARSRHP